MAPQLVCAAAGASLAAAGLRAVFGHGAVLDLHGWLGLGASGLRADPLSGLFLAVAGVVAVPVAFGFAGWAAPAGRVARRGLGALHAVTLAAVTAVVLADNAFLFLFAWESVTVAFYLLAGFDRDRPGRLRASLVTIGIGKLGGAALLVGLLLLANEPDRCGSPTGRPPLPARPGPRPTRCCSSRSRRRWAWSRCRSGCPTGTRRHRRRPGR